MASSSIPPWITSMIIASLLVTLNYSHIALALKIEFNEEVNGHFLGLNLRSGSRFLTRNVKKGDSCHPTSNNICPGTPAKNGTELLTCCKNHCRDVLSNRNHCGGCENKCGFGQLCCKGNCTVVAYDVNNCGKCGNVCEPGVRCEYGNCGYA